MEDRSSFNIKRPIVRRPNVQTSKRPNVQRPTPDVERCMLLKRIENTLTHSLLSLAAVLPVE